MHPLVLMEALADLKTLLFLVSSVLLVRAQVAAPESPIEGKLAWKVKRNSDSLQ